MPRLLLNLPVHLRLRLVVQVILPSPRAHRAGVHRRIQLLRVVRSPRARHGHRRGHRHRHHHLRAVLTHHRHHHHRHGRTVLRIPAAVTTAAAASAAPFFPAFTPHDLRVDAVDRLPAAALTRRLLRAGAIDERDERAVLGVHRPHGRYLTVLVKRILQSVLVDSIVDAADVERRDRGVVRRRERLRLFVGAREHLVRDWVVDAVVPVLDVLLTQLGRGGELRHVGIAVARSIRAIRAFARVTQPEGAYRGLVLVVVRLLARHLL